MKEFYVMNLDLRRIAIIAGGALTALGLTLFIGMAIGRSQGERNARISSEENQQQKLGLNNAESADKLVLASGPTDVERRPAATEKFSALEKVTPSVPVIPSVPETKSEIPLREDPLVAGPPRKSASGKKTKKTARSEASDEETAEKPRKKKSIAKAKKEEPEVSGRVEHASKKRRKRSQLSEDADDQLAAVAGTAKAERSASARYTIQVAAFKRSSEANNLIEKLKGEGIKARSEHQGDFYLVTVGRTKSKSKLEKALSRLKELEYEAYIRKLET